MMTDYREDGMDLGSDASSRSSSESNSNKVTPCSPSLDLATLEDYKSSPSLDLVTLEDYEEDEDYQEYKKKVIEEWESEYGEGYTSPQPPGQEEVRGGGVVGEDILGEGYRKTVNSRSLAEELEDVKTVPPPPGFRRTHCHLGRSRPKGTETERQSDFAQEPPAQLPRYTEWHRDS
ncbi:hypothetical protein CgunFtcFv8_010686 [Champsocephalus gunnari]|uniref:Schwannomin interacting protein 1 n=1 Tax=Champsocephalus gunnari TaxID=52237 RepID=A0AAN8DUE6_CHAGU|nr:hypothetical protein CgunFtcFv8_010686 [Champsocephalus gunnari]